MNNLFWGILAILLCACGWLAWQYFRLRRLLDHYTLTLEKAVRDNPASVNLPRDVYGIESLSDAVHSYGLSQDARMEKLETERARLEATLTQITDGVLIVDAQGRIQMANPAAEKMFGSGEALNGQTVSLALRHHQLIETWRKCQQTREVQSDSIDLSVLRKFLQIIAIPDKHSNGAILLVQDLTRIRRLETVRRDFISNVSHELRTPLASLRALTETLQEGALDDPPAAQRFLGRIQIEVDALTQMATELLELSRIESGQMPLILSPIQPIDLLYSAADRMKMQAERAGLNLQVLDTQTLPRINADMPRLEQVLVNLIHNAVKFTSPGGEINLAAQLQGQFICFSVKDSGAGIPTDDLSRIFERFYRVDRSRTGGGTGLGLSIAKHIIENHDGRIWAESREGEGSTFFFTIPISRA